MEAEMQMHHISEQAQCQHHLETLYWQAEAARAARLAHPRRARWWRVGLAGWRATLVIEPERQVAR